MKRIISLLICLSCIAPIRGQEVTFDPDIAISPPDERLINLVILSDGYRLTEASMFNDDANDFITEFQSTEVFARYLDYFKIYKVFVESDDSGVLHPGTGCGESTTITPPVNTSLVTAFGSSLDNSGLHRLLQSNPMLVNSFLDQYFDNVTVSTVILVNTDEYCGGANQSDEIAHAGARYSTNGCSSTPPGTPYCDERIAVHEFGHTFANLMDEYYYPGPSGPNKEFATAGNQDEWDEWIGTNNDIDYHEHHDLTSCDDPTYASAIPDWWKPTSGVTGFYDGMCKMEQITEPFCSVCKEAIVERIHNLVDPIESITPVNTAVPLDASENLVFDVELIEPDPSWMQVQWYLNETAVGDPIEADGADAGTTDFSWTFDCTSSLLVEGENTVSFEVFDLTGNVDSDPTLDTRWVRVGSHDNHVYNDQSDNPIEWTVVYNGEATFDLYIPDDDGTLDLGQEPDNVVFPIFLSPSIFANYGTYGDGDEQPYEYDSMNDINLYVDVCNRGCENYVAQNENAVIEAYWAKASTTLTWPDHWDGSENLPSSSLPTGGVIGQANVPDIDGASSEVEQDCEHVEISWTMPDPAPYNAITNDWHFCLLARMIDTDDPMEDELDGSGGIVYNVGYNTKHNNNIAWKNVTVNDDIPGIDGIDLNNDVHKGGAVAIDNLDSIAHDYEIHFIAPTETGNKLTDEAEVRVMLSDTLWSRWQSGGAVSSGISVHNATENLLILDSDSATIGNIHLDSSEFGIMYIGYNFLTQEVSGKDSFNLYVEVYLDSTDTLVGGEGYLIIPDPDRTLFTANAGSDFDMLIDSTFQIIGEMKGALSSDTGIFNWYSQGTLIHTGDTLNDTLSTPGVVTYTLEVIAETDGYKDYDDVTVTVTSGIITSVVPNPASTNTVVSYKTSGITNASLSVVEVNTSTEVDNLTVTPGIGSKTIDVSGYNTGAHIITLVGDSENLDTETLMVQ